jgi:hypothetical protein
LAKWRKFATKKISGKNKIIVCYYGGTNGLLMKAEEGCDISHQQSQRYTRGYCVKVRMKKRKSVYTKKATIKLLTHWKEDCFAISAAQHRSSSTTSSSSNNNNNNEVV